MTGTFRATIPSAIVLGAGEYLVEITNGTIRFYQQQATVRTGARVPKAKVKAMIGTAANPLKVTEISSEVSQ